jgi:F-type H+-transporting ATPase subunit a
MRMLATLSLIVFLAASQLFATSSDHTPTDQTQKHLSSVSATKSHTELAATPHGSAKNSSGSHASVSHDENHGETANAHGGHGDHGDAELSSGEKVRHVIEHHLTDGTHLELPLLNPIDLSNMKIRAPFFDNLHASTREGNPLIYWMVEDGHAYIPVTKHIVFMWLALVLVLVVLLLARRTAGTSKPRGIGNFIEVFILFIRDEVVLPNTGEEGRRYMPFFLTVFFFILFMNLLGMIPFGASATGNLSVTAGLALCAFIFMQITGIKAHGFLGHFKGLMPGGVPIVIAPILVPIEFLGMFTKPFALCVRLFANMMAGHAVIAAFLGLILVPAIALASVPVSIAISMLELFVAFLQAYIFTMLTAIFAGTFIHQH